MKKLIIASFALCLAFLFSCTTEKDDLNIAFEKYTLDNGLEVILHVDRSDPIVAFAVQYHVGSSREEKGRTGFAHLFEHMMFQRSENVGEDQFFKLIQNAGGTLNGFTNNDATTYFEIVPKNALEMVLWMESDRMGYMINTVTQKTFAIQQNVVQNEKRQGVDNRPYGHAQWIIAKNLYPDGHPYSWTVIGEMEDLFNATVEDVKEFHSKYYVPNNSTIVIAGDFDVDETKKMIEKYFGDISSGKSVKDPEPQYFTLNKTKKVYHEDNFAKAAQLYMCWPTVEQYHPDTYALSYLAELLSSGKKSPFYKVLEKEKKLTSNQRAWNYSTEIAGTYDVIITANDGISLKEIENAVFESFARFEKEGFYDEDVERIKASLETNFYNSINSILGKSMQLARFNEFAGDPSYYKKDIEMLKAVTKEDIQRVYNTYIKNKPYLAVSFVPKGQLDKMAEGSINANVAEENILNATQVEITDDSDDKFEKTKTTFDRSVQPAIGPDPKLNLPKVWQTELKNNLKVYGIEHNELPLIQFNIVLKGGHYLDIPEKSGTASLMARLMMEGTKDKTPQELEEAIDKLGATIRISANDHSITISANTLARNYHEVLKLVEEILLDPRWDEEEFELEKTSVLNNLIRQNANPNTLARQAFNKLTYGPKHICSIEVQGTIETVSSININDLKKFYLINISPSIAFFNIAGQISKEEVIKSLNNLAENWKNKKVVFPEYSLPDSPSKSKIYFVDIPGAKQSVINIGNLGLAQTDPDYFATTVMNYKLGGSFQSHVNMVLREEKGFTYGARTSFNGSFIPGVFIASSSVRSTATLESVEIFKKLMEQYREDISEDELKSTKNALLKSYARQFETLGALNGMLREIGMYNHPVDFIKNEENTIRNMTIEQHKKLAQKYIDPSKMYYVIAGDAETQLKPLEKIGFGKPVLFE